MHILKGSMALVLVGIKCPWNSIQVIWLVVTENILKGIRNSDNHNKRSVFPRGFLSSIAEKHFVTLESVSSCPFTISLWKCQLPEKSSNTQDIRDCLLNTSPGNSYVGHSSALTAMKTSPDSVQHHSGEKAKVKHAKIIT